MEPKQILSASILDLVFDNRNKDYGAYELRYTYPRRIVKALFFTATVVGLAFAGVALGNSAKPPHENGWVGKVVEVTEIKPEEPVQPPPPEVKPPEPQVKTERFLEMKVVPDDIADPDPPPTQADVIDAKIGDKTQDGLADPQLATTLNEIDKPGIIEQKKDDGFDPNAIQPVQIEAKCDCNWEKFLRNNLRGEVPSENGAPAGRYTVMVQFVVDVEGNVSDIKALTAQGYGMEEEAIRVLRKAIKWQPGIQAGRPVKSYRRQPITFVIED